MAADTGIAEAADDPVWGGGLFADYATSGIDNEGLSLALAGIAGTLIALAVGFGMLFAIRDRKKPRRPGPATA